MAWCHLQLIGIFAGFISVAIAQGINQPPTWVTSSYIVLTQGISEDTPVGTSLTQLVCTDPEHDLVLYSLQSGNAVRVFSNGTVVLAVKLDFEKRDLTYDLVFICFDVDNITGAAKHGGVKVNVQISVSDSNDNPPEFQVSNAQGFAFTVRECDPNGTVVEQSIRTIDLDRTVNAALRTMYLICNSPDPVERNSQPESSKAMCQYFALTYRQEGEGIYTANITLIRQVDYEQRAVYTSKIVAIDGPGLNVSFTSIVNVQINVIDCQDTLVYFTNPGSSVTVKENEIIGSIIPNFGVSARDGDTGDKRPIFLSIIQDPKNAFNLTNATEATPGEGIYFSRLIINNNLDRESIPGGVYDIVLKATEIDKNTSQLTQDTAIATYSIIVSDRNDNGPKFSQPMYWTNVTEVDSNVKTNGTQIPNLIIFCSDPDEPSNAQYTVRIILQTIGVGADAINVTDAYSISPSVPYFTGNSSIFLKVENTKYQDYDIPLFRVHTLVLKAEEVGPNPMYSDTTVVQINITDINDNAPQFYNASYVIYISEASPFPKDLLNVTAYDIDSGRNGMVRYYLEGGVSGKFSINNVTGVLTLIGALDYETTSVYVFLAYATDLAVDPKSSQVQITVYVLNVNDVPPRFQQTQYQTSANESSTEFLTPVQVKAEDDEDDTPRITYKIISGQNSQNSFVLDPVTGILTLRTPLDYTDTPKGADGKPSGQFTLVIEASDNGVPELTARAIIIIIVIAQNKKSPVFDPKEYNATLNETVKQGTFVVWVYATDGDVGDNGKITYILGEGATDNFLVNETSGRITTGPALFDYDVQNFYRLLIIAVDGGTPQLSGSAYVYVYIEDVDNKNPVFPEALYLIDVDDRQLVNSIIRTITATDQDRNAYLEYAIDYNNIKATGPSGAPITSTTPYNYMEAFAVFPNGSIYINKKLDHNQMVEITFPLIVTDKNTQEGTGTASTQVTIIIRGEPNQNITFDPVNQVYMNEDANLGYSPITVTARDANNQQVNNYIKLNGSSDNFAVNQQTGRITLVKQIDYENDPMSNHLHIVNVGAYSSDGKYFAFVKVIIAIMDVNDNNPEFTQKNCTAFVSETAVYPKIVLTVSATDRDSKSYGPLLFSLTGLDSGDFDVFNKQVPSGPQVSREGSVIVAEGKTLDYNRRSQYDLFVLVEDNTGQNYSSVRLSNILQCIIYIIDENDHTPVIKESERTVAVAETAEIGRSIATIIATDEDHGSNGKIDYSLQAFPTSDSALAVTLFSIEQDSGVVRVAKSLIGYGNQLFSVRVLVSDRGNVPRSSLATLYIKVLSTEDNDGNPKWLYPPSGFVLYAIEELAPQVVNNSICNVIPRTGTTIIYSLSPFSDSFDSLKINNVTGELTIVKPLDREKQEVYKVMVIAKDNNDTAKYQTGRTFYLKLIDINDNNATFTNPRNYTVCGRADRPYLVYLDENVGANVTITTIRACDADLPPYNAIKYCLYNGSEYCAKINNISSMVLRLEPNGQVVTIRNVDYEQEKEFLMCVEAVAGDSSRRKRRSFDLTQVDIGLQKVTYVQFIVQDINDNGPKFPQNSRDGVVPINPGTGPIMRLDAKDPDGPRNNVTLYRIETSIFYPQGKTAASPFSGAFNLRGELGALYASLPSYQAYSDGYFVLKIVATDSLNSSLTDTQTLYIYVYEKGQALKIILGLKPATGSQNAQTIVNRLDDVSQRYKFVFLRVSDHVTGDSVDVDKTDICFLAVDDSSRNILNIRQLIELLDQQRYQNVLRTPEYHFIDEGQCYPSQSSESDIKWRDLWWVLVAVAIFIFVCCVILLILVSILYDRYKRYMETKKDYMDIK